MRISCVGEILSGWVAPVIQLCFGLRHRPLSLSSSPFVTIWRSNPVVYDAAAGLLCFHARRRDFRHENAEKFIDMLSVSDQERCLLKLTAKRLKHISKISVYVRASTPVTSQIFENGTKRKYFEWLFRNVSPCMLCICLGSFSYELGQGNMKWISKVQEERLFSS